MDTRTGKLYPDRNSALVAGVPVDSIREVDIVTIMSGPFKGRKYVKNSDGSLGARVRNGKVKIESRESALVL